MHSWPDSPTPFPVGDGRFAAASESPGSPEAMCEFVRRASVGGLAVYPQGGATALDWGRPPARPGVVACTRSLDRVIDYPAADMTITVEAGMTLSALQALLAPHNQRLTLETPRPGRATLGGIFATSTSGPRRFGHGRPRDLIIGISFVTAAGELVKGGGRVVKNVAGYDLPKLLTGSFGTLGIITQLTLKVRPKPAATGAILAAIEGPEMAARVLDSMNTSSTRPVAIELMNAPAAALAGIETASPWLLAVGFEGNRPAVDAQIGSIESEVEAPPEQVVRDAEDEALWQRLADAQHPADSTRWTIKANLPASAVAGFAASLDLGRWAVLAGAGTGIVWAHALAGTEDGQIEMDVLAARGRAVAERGNLIVPTCPTARKERTGVWGEPRADWALAEKLKGALDPQGVLNPGRFVGRI